MKPSAVLRIAGWLFPFGLAAFIQLRMGWPALLEPWRRLDAIELATAVGLILLTYLLRSLRQRNHFPEQMRGRFWLCTRLTVWHTFYNHLLPMRAGELAFPVLARRYFGIPYASAVGALVWFRLLDLWAIGLAALAAAGTSRRAMLVAAIALLPLPWLASRFVRPAEAETAGRFAAISGRVRAAVPRGAAAVGCSAFWTAANWGVKLLAFAWLLRVFSGMPYPAAVMGAIGGDMTSVLPLHAPAGLGTFEAGVLAGAAPYGVSAANAVAAALSLHLIILASTLTGALVTSLIPLPRTPDAAVS